MASDISYFFGGPIAINIFLIGGGLNLILFKRMNFPLDIIFGIKKDEIPSSNGILKFSFFLFFLIGFIYYIFKLNLIFFIGKYPETILLIYSIFIFLFFFIPFNIFHLKFRLFLGRTLKNCIFPFIFVNGNQFQLPYREIPFLQVYIADGLTSMSKIFQDLAVAGLMGWRSFHGIHDDMYATKMKHHLLPYLAAASPYMIRSIQCLISYHRATLVNDKFLHVLNTFKYGTGLCVILVGALPVLFGPSPQHLLDTDTLFLLCACCNSLYSLFWDIVMDWGLGQPRNTQDVSEDEENDRNPPLWNSSKMNHHTYLRHTLLYHPKQIYFIAIVLDGILRILWVTSNWHWVDVVGADFKMVAQIAEVFRRCMWNVFRVEWQCVKLGLYKSSDEKLNEMEKTIK